MLFRKDIEPCCAYCQHGLPINLYKVGCLKHGVVPYYGQCRKFIYDPLKREPERPRKLPISDDDDSGEMFRL